MNQNPATPALPAAVEKELRKFNNSFFDASLLAGWMRCVATGGFAIRYINEYFVKLLCYDSREELLKACGGSYTALMDPQDDVTRIVAASMDLPIDGNAVFTYRLVKKTGDALWVREHSHKYLDPDGTPMLLSLCIDITDVVSLERSLEEQEKALKHVNAALSKERRYLKLLNDNIPVGTAIFKLDEAGTLLHVGGNMLSGLGYTREEFAVFQKNHLRGFVFEPDYGTAFHDARVHPDGPQPAFEHEYRVVKKDGSLIWMTERGTLTEVAEGELGYVCVFIDVTRRKEMEERLRVSEAEMNLAMSQMGKMVCVFDPVARTLTLPEAYAAQYGVKTVLSNMPDSLDALHLLSDSTREAYLGLFEAIRRGEKSGAAEYYIRRADGVWRWERAEFAAIFGMDNRPRKAIVSIEDTTQRHAMDDEAETLRENERLLRMVAAHSNRLIYRYDIATKTAYADETAASAANSIVSDTDVPESIIARGVVLPESVEDCRRVFRKIDAGTPSGSAKIHICAQDGTPRWVDMRYSVLDYAGDRPKTAVLSFADITDIHEKELAYERYRQTIGAASPQSGVVYFETDLTADVVENQGGNIPLLRFPPNGCTHMEAVDYGVDSLLASDERARARAFFGRAHLLGAFSDGTYSLTEDWPAVLPGAGPCWFRSEVQMIQDPYSGHVKAYIILRDVTEEKLAALEVQKKAEIDGNTGLYNKTTTESLIRERLAKPAGELCALLIADLDDFKQINDHFGHAQGDRALLLVAEALQSQFRRTDLIGRVGGDEFMAYLAGADSEAKLRGTMTALMRRIAALRIGELNDVPLHMSIGVAFGVTGAATFEELYRKADRALYHVKRNGKNDYAFYAPDMEQANYRYARHANTALWQPESLGKAELDRLLYAVSAIYPLVISVNLTKNSYYMMQYSRFTTTACRDVGVFDELIANGAVTFDPLDRESFLAAFSRQNLLAAHARGETAVSHQGRQLGDDGVYRLIRTDVIFVGDESGDVQEITLARELDPASDS